MEDNSYIQRGRKYLLEIEVPETISESDRHKLEGHLLHSLHRSLPFLESAKLTSIYRADFDTEALVKAETARVIENVGRALIFTQPDSGSARDLNR